MNPCIALLAVALLAGPGHGRAAGQLPLWGELQAGPFAVGFRSHWASDPSRTFRYKFADGTIYGGGRAPRPILVEEWYPAVVASPSGPLTEGAYLDFVTAGGPQVGRFAQDLADKCRAVISEDVVGKIPSELDAQGRAALTAYLGMPTAASREAEQAPGPFPLVVYLQGYGSSLQDNSALCEYLASWGYVVLGSAYQDSQAHMIADRDTVAADIRVLIQLARRMRSVDLEHVALIGHSGGAQSAMVYASQEGAIVDAVVSLDTTQDYYFNDKGLFKSYIDRVRPEGLTVPLLVAADRPAIFDFVDTCDKSHRLYLTVDELGHEEYTSQGLAAAIIQKKDTLDAVRRRFSSLCEFVLRFLDARLKLREDAARALDVAPPNFAAESVPAGVRGPSPYARSAEPPSPRQFRLLVDSDVGSAVDLLFRFAKSRPNAAIYDGQLAFAVVDHLLEKQEVGWARRYSDALRKIKGKEIVGARIYLEWGKIYGSRGVKAEAERAYRKALMLDPGNKKAKDELVKLK